MARVKECTGMQQLGSTRFGPLTARKAYGPADGTAFFGHTSRKRRLNGIKFVPVEKFGGANQISILPWPDSRPVSARQQTEAGSHRGDYVLRVAGVEPLAQRSDYSTSIHDR